MPREMSRRESVQNLVGINDWPTQLAVLKVMFNTDDLNVKYLDDENDEIKIDNQNDYEFANQIASSSTNNVLRLILRNSRDEIVCKVNLSVDLTSKSSLGNSCTSLNNSRITSSMDSMRSSIERIMPPPSPSNLHSNTSSTHTLPPVASAPSALNSSIAPATTAVLQSPPFTPAQLAWLDNHLSKFKSELMRELAAGNANKSRLGGAAVDHSDLISFVERDDDERQAGVESKVQRLFSLIVEARLLKRSLRAAYLEEELQSTGAFMAEFIKDQNMPDGSECEPGMRFDKTWLIRNVGQLAWTEAKFPVRLVCIAGNIASVDDVECVQVPETSVNETASISVALVAPPIHGVFYSEWVLCCNGFRFGPRIWCNIQVTGGGENGECSTLVSKEQLSLAASIYSEKVSKQQQQQQQSMMINAMQNANLASHEDLDDEFVVIPDCFDLDKKWKQQQQQIKNSLKPSSSINLNDIGFHSDDEDEVDSISKANNQLSPLQQQAVDLIMLESDPALKKSGDLTSSDKSNLDSSIERICNSSSSNVVEATQPTQPSTTALASSSAAEYVVTRLVGERLSLSETQDPKFDFDDDQIELARNNNNTASPANRRLADLAAAAVATAPVNVPKTSDRVDAATASSGSPLVNSNISQAIGYMKDALSNLGRPSYVGSIPLQAERSGSTEDNLKELITMGFCNRQLNLKLLRKHNNDLSKVIQNLLEVTDNNWAENR